jgi:adenosine deaminase/adenosine deaminase CECR1
MEYAMRTILVIATALIVSVFTSIQASDYKNTAALYNLLINSGNPNNAQLTLFCSAMPKGADIHHHYSGSIYAETYLAWADSANMYIDTTTLKPCTNPYISGNHTDSTYITIQQLYSRPQLYRNLLSVWSDKDFYNHSHEQLAPDQNFFNTFPYFSSVAKDFVKGLQLIKKQSLNDNISYVETMLDGAPRKDVDTAFNTAVLHAGNAAARTNLFEAKFKYLDSLSKKDTIEKSFLAMLDSVHKSIDNDSFTMRFQTYATRIFPPSTTFAAMYSAFSVANSSLTTNNTVVGVNLVGSENDVVAIRDYATHMEMMGFFHGKYPKVAIALHAGELALGMVPVNELRYHITQAVQIACAKRIGHGVDLPYENNAVNLLKRLKDSSVAVEINLTSNEFILGVKDDAHPYRIYSAYNVPIVISSDDAGVSRNNLSAEYVLLATRYKPAYATIKNYAYNSITYSFLSDSDKKTIKKRLDARFKQFESQMCNYYNLIKDNLK